MFVCTLEMFTTAEQTANTQQNRCLARRTGALRMTETLWIKDGDEQFEIN